MYKYIYIFLIVTIFMSCQKPTKKLSISQYDPSSNNFAFLKESLKDVRILSIGESSKGFGSMHSLKRDMVKYLHQEMGFDVLVMEGGYGDVGISWYNYDKSTPTQLINSMFSGVTRSEELLPMFEYLQENAESERPLEFRGMDTKVSGLAFNFRLMYVIKRLEPRIIQDSVENGLKFINKTFEVLDDREKWQKYMDRYLQAIDLAQSILTESREDIKELELAEDEEIEILQRYLEMMVSAVDYEFGEAYTRGLAIRDSLMAENVFNIVDKEFPKSKIIIWGHNGHIEKGAGIGDNIKWLGHYLKEKYGDDYYALGMYAKKGFMKLSVSKKPSAFDIADPSYIEGKIDADYGKNVYLDLPLYDESNTSWVNKPIFGYEPEAGGKVNFVPTKRFDGVLLLGETTAPVYLVKPKKTSR